MHRRIPSLSGLAAGVALAGLAFSSRPAFAKGAPSPLVGVTSISVTVAGSDTGAACTITGPSSPAGLTLKCADGTSQGSATCVCHEYTGQFKGTQIGSGVFTFDVIDDESGNAGPSWPSLPIPGIGGALTCDAATVVGVMQKSGKTPLVVATLNGAGQLCPPLSLPSPFGAPIPSGFNGAFVFTDTTICPALPAGACLFPTATGAGNLAGEVIPATPNQVRFTMTGQFKRK